MVVTSEPQGRKLDDILGSYVFLLKSGDHQRHDAEMKDQCDLVGLSGV
jgi:hypothetical protein